MAIPAIVYGLFTFFNAIIFGIIMKRLIYKEFKNKRKRNVS
jgi:ABC-type phosphate transport system permease subunit